MFVHLFYPLSFSCMRVNVWAHRTRETVEVQNWGKSLRVQQKLYFISVSGEGMQDCHFLLLKLNNILTFLLALSGWVLCSDNGWDSPEKLPLLLPKRSVCSECLFSFSFMSFCQVPWESQQFQKLRFSFWLATILRKHRAKNISNCKCEGWKKCHQDPHQICLR